MMSWEVSQADGLILRLATAQAVLLNLPKRAWQNLVSETQPRRVALGQTPSLSPEVRTSFMDGPKMIVTAED